jgi:hypothetical protein
MRFERSVDVNASQQRLWDVITDLEAWPRRIETVDTVELLSPGPVRQGSRIRMRQPKLGEGVWEITVWDAPSFFEMRQKSGGVTSVAGQRVEASPDGRSRLTLTLEMSGLLVPIFGRIFKDLTERYMTSEAEDMKRAAESVGM